MIDIHAIARHYGGTVSSGQALIPTPGHSRRDRGTAIKASANAPDSALVCCYNGGRPDALIVKDMLRRDGFLPGKRHELSEPQRQALRDAARREEKARRRKQSEAVARALDLWRAAGPPDRRHPYLVAKALSPFGVRQNGNLLLVPMFDDRFCMSNVQRITPTGKKLFLPGARTVGLFWPHGLHNSEGAPSAGPVVIAEGYGTAAAIHEATGLGVVAALSWRNLLSVAKAMRGLFLDRQVIIAADHDGHLPVNIGQQAARTAADVIGGNLASPVAAANEHITAGRKIDFADLPRADVAVLILAACRQVVRNG